MAGEVARKSPGFEGGVVDIRIADAADGVTDQVGQLVLVVVLGGVRAVRAAGETGAEWECDLPKRPVNPLAGADRMYRCAELPVPR
ncbi:hypothetical protein [Streptomyces avermitilis]|uniref:hypothetical protein n=1 Tax=Streptomyces avermitilis TaxID=33903 RepID=UPI0033FD2C88